MDTDRAEEGEEDKDGQIESSRGRKVSVKSELPSGARRILSRQSCVHFSGYLGTWL